MSAEIIRPSWLVAERAPEGNQHERHAQAFFDMEDDIRSLELMANIAEDVATDTFTRGELAEQERWVQALFAIQHLQDMIVDFKAAYHRHFNG